MSDPSLIARTTCRSCGSSLQEILDLGPLYLSDFPHSAGTKLHPPVPLDLQRCTNPDCGLVQLAHTTPKEWLYNQYWYRSGVNETMVQELGDIVRSACGRVTLHAHDTVVDIGANDGTLLRQYAPHPKVLRVAFEPAANLYTAVRPHAEVVFPEFFAAPRPWDRNLRARIVTAIAMFYDLEDPHAFLSGISHILADDGLFIVQQAYLHDMIASTGFDNICHEHLEYYDLRAMDAVLVPHGLEVVDVERRAINGGSFRTYIQRVGRGTVHPRVWVMRREEMEYATHPDAIWGDFTARVDRVRQQLPALLQLYQKHGELVDLYAASTKANTLLQACGIDARLVRQSWERSPEKIGRYVGVSGIPIVSEQAGRADPPAALLVGAYQFRDQFLRRETEYLQAGGRMIFPLPEVDVVTGMTAGEKPA